MTVTPEVPGIPSVSKPSGDSKWRLIAAAVALVAVVAVGIAAFALTRDPAGASDAQRISTVSAACERWVGRSSSGAGAALPSSRWCHDFSGWMRGQVSGDGMMGSTMWASPAAMRETCRRWMATEAGDAALNADSWCDGMVSWMSQNSGNGHWMMRQ